MLKRHKGLMRTLVGTLRHILIGSTSPDGIVTRGDLDRELEHLGIAPDGTIAPFDVLVHPTSDERRVYRVVTAQLEACDRAQRAGTRIEIIERAAYSWMFRFFALRAMGTRGLIEETLRTNPDYDGIPKALFILRQTDPGRASSGDGGRWAVLEDVCIAQTTALPGLFDLNDPTTVLRPSIPALIRCMTLVGGTMPGFTLAEVDAAFAEPDAIGWAYQFYQEESKAEIYAKLGRGGKVTTRPEISAATQLFTEPYMVKWLLQNSLGRSYHEIYQDSALPATWEYYIQPDPLDASTTLNMASLTVLDPCMGSGHFLREAFDMLVAMYCEQFHTFSATEIADRILSHHLYGIDIDPRAAQLSALTLYLRACELIRNERCKEHKPGPGSYIPPSMNLATTPTSLTEGALQRHLHRHPQDMPLKPLLEGIFAGFEQGDRLGSLLRSKEYLDSAINELQRTHTIRMNFDPGEAELRRTISEMANRDPAGLRQMLLDRIADTFKVEAGNVEDVSVVLFGQEAEQGVRLLQLLDKRYAVVVTNPPYMGSKNMDDLLKKYVEKYYPSGRRDLYTAFILRCLELCRPHGRVAMVTQQSWLFLRSFAELRAMPEEKLLGGRKRGAFTGLLRATTFESVVQLGANAFEEIKGEVVQTVLFTVTNTPPVANHAMTALRLIGLKMAQEKAETLASKHLRAAFSYRVLQKKFLSISYSPLCYWLPSHMINLLQGHTIGDEYSSQAGVTIGNNHRFLRKFWEIEYLSKGMLKYVKGGGYQKWAGLEQEVLLWGLHGERIKGHIDMHYAYLRENYGWLLKENTFFVQGWCWTLMAQGVLGVRKLDGATVFDSASPAVFGQHIRPGTGLVLNCRITSYVLRTISSDVKYRESYVARAPFPVSLPDYMGKLEDVAVLLKSWLVSCKAVERTFLRYRIVEKTTPTLRVQSILHAVEGFGEFIVFKAMQLDVSVTKLVLEEMGTPAGWYPLIAGYDTLPVLPEEVELPSLPQAFFDYLAKHERIEPQQRELARIKANVKAYYEAGPRARYVELQKSTEVAVDENGNEEEEVATAAFLPMPPETFLEELCTKIELHPLSVYWLLEELRSKGVRCKPEEIRMLEDRLSVLVLSILGYRWPEQLEAGDTVPDWVDRDGIIPLVAGIGLAPLSLPLNTARAQKATLVEQVRARLRAEDGDLSTQQTEALLAELMNVSLEEWLRKQFFPRHVSQFKYRPIVWHLASTPVTSGKKRRSGSQRRPAFECFLYYHACTGDVLARIRTQYVEPLIRAERQRLEDTLLFIDETASVLSHNRIQELQTFAEKLRFIEEQGFACAELDTIMAEEPLDRWSGDGYLPPSNRDELLHNERAWCVDINDGVRVNIAPLQLVGVLANDVLKPIDAKKAIADRARWRADERRWVRDGKLPRCGWMNEQVPESSRWTERETIRKHQQKTIDNHSTHQVYFS